MSGELVATLIAVYNLPKKSGLSSGGTILPLRFLLPGPCGRPAIIQAIPPSPGTKRMITNHAHFGKDRILSSGVLEQSIIE